MHGLTCSSLDDILVPMYIRKDTRRHKDRVYTNYRLVEAYHTPDGPRQRTICSLGDLAPRPHHEWLALAHRLQAALEGKRFLFEPEGEDAELIERVRRRRRRGKRPLSAPPAAAVSVVPEQVEVLRAREAGPLHVGLAFWEWLGCDDVLREAGLRPRSRELTCAMVMNRLIAPSSEHAMGDWMQRTAMDDLLGVHFAWPSLSALYRNLDRLYDKREAIEASLTRRQCDLFDLDAAVYLIDLTSSYFEGAALANPKAARGYSRDKRSDCKQVVVGLAIDHDGFPQAHEVFRGNLRDSASLPDMLDRLEHRLGGFREGQTVVVDRGMSGEKNLAQIRERNLHYLVAARQGERVGWLAQFEALEGFEEVLREPSPRNPSQKPGRVWVKRASDGAETVALCISEGRRQKDRAIRESHEARLLADLDRLQERVASRRLVKPEKIAEAIGRLRERYPRVARYYDLEYRADTGELHAALRSERRDIAERVDGAYLLKTDRQDLSGEEIWRLYVLLARAENAFRNMKSSLAMRPMFHQIEPRVDTHIFLSVMAYRLLVAIEKTLLDQGVHSSWNSVRDALRTHQVVTVALPTDDGTEIRVRRPTTPEPAHLEIYRQLGVPPTLMHTRKSVHRIEA